MKKIFLVILIIISFTCIFAYFDDSHFIYNGIDQSETNFTDRFIDRLYFTASAASTVGYGHITPRTNVTKLLTILMIFIMIFTVLY